MRNDALLSEIETWCDRRDMTVTEFGRRATGDGSLVTRIRRGADLRSSTVERVRSFMGENDDAFPDTGADQSKLV